MEAVGRNKVGTEAEVVVGVVAGFGGAGMKKLDLNLRRDLWLWLEQELWAGVGWELRREVEQELWEELGRELWWQVEQEAKL